MCFACSGIPIESKKSSITRILTSEKLGATFISRRDAGRYMMHPALVLLIHSFKFVVVVLCSLIACLYPCFYFIVILDSSARCIQ
jgi:hypothetical protein